MLFAFEISGTLLITASLGFLGYYVGGDIYTQVGDYTAHRLSGMPELGQMLATSWSILNKPWGRFAVGSTIFIMILGFNLLGEGMQRRLGAAPSERRTLYSLTIGRVGKWIEDRILLPVADRDRRLVLRATPIALVRVIAIGGFAWWQAQASAVPAAPLPELAVPGGHLWATERHDACVAFTSRSEAPIRTLRLEQGRRVEGGAVSDGRMYVTTADGYLYAIGNRQP